MTKPFSRASVEGDSAKTKKAKLKARKVVKQAKTQQQEEVPYWKAIGFESEWEYTGFRIFNRNDTNYIDIDEFEHIDNQIQY